MANSLETRRFWSGIMVVGITLIAGFSQSAEARIVCKNGNQLVAGNWISTPFCEDQRVAEVANEYGMKVSAHSVRNNPSVKEEVCRLIGHDIRVNMSCATVLPDLHGRGAR